MESEKKWGCHGDEIYSSRRHLDDHSASSSSSSSRLSTTDKIFECHEWLDCNVLLLLYGVPHISYCLKQLHSTSSSTSCNKLLQHYRADAQSVSQSVSVVAIPMSFSAWGDLGQEPLILIKTTKGTEIRRTLTSPKYTYRQVTKPKLQGLPST